MKPTREEREEKIRGDVESPNSQETESEEKNDKTTSNKGTE